MTVHVMGIGIHHIVQALVALNVGTTVPLLLLPLVDILQSVLATARKDAASSLVTTGTALQSLWPPCDCSCCYCGINVGGSKTASIFELRQTCCCRERL